VEYIIVRFNPAAPRQVLANGDPVGQTDSELTIPPDFYRITLAGQGYEPPFWEGPVTGTGPAHPLQIVFSHA
jgi:hypothetical protein